MKMTNCISSSSHVSFHVRLRNSCWKYWRKLRRTRCRILVMAVLLWITLFWLTMDMSGTMKWDHFGTASYRGPPASMAADGWIRKLLELDRASERTARRRWFPGEGESDGSLRAAHPSVFSRTNVTCSALFAGNREELGRARAFMEHHTQFTISPAQYSHLVANCSEFRRSRGYHSEPRSAEEARFPIAFSILAKHNVQQVERLLRAIYAPQNFYCIHVDAKASRPVINGLMDVVGCFDNVFIASKLERVYWGHISIMYAEMNCIENLLKYQWKYFINLSSQMFPAHTNAELVRILTEYDGANDIEGTLNRSNHYWAKVRYLFRWSLIPGFNMMFLTMYPKGTPPHNITIYKGSNQVVITRAFAVYFMYSRVSRDIISWFSDTLAPDEYIWPTLNHNLHLHAPGSYKGDPESKVFTARASLWHPIADQIDWSWKKRECAGKWVREICILSIGDMPWMIDRPELFLNKFHSNYHWLAYDCVEELIFNRTITSSLAEITDQSAASLTSSNFDLTYYKALPFVENKTHLVVSLLESIHYHRNRKSD